MKTLQDLAEELTTEWGEPLSDTDTVDQVKEWIQDGFTDIAAETEWRFLEQTDAFSTVASTRVYSLDSAASEVTSGRITSTDAPIVYKSKQELIARGVDLELEGTYPIYFYNEGYDADNGQNQIGLYPIPVGVLALEFTEDMRAEELSDDSIIPLPNELMLVLKIWVRKEMARDDKDFEEWKALRTEYNEKLEKRKRKKRNAPAAHYKRLGVSDIPTSTPMNQVRFDPNHFRN